MDLTGIYRIARYLPRPMRARARSLADHYFDQRGYPMAGHLAGCYMAGKVYGAYLDGSYEPDVARTILRFVQPGAVCADVGAHLGYFTLLLAKCTGPYGQIVAFEAYPPNAEQLRTNIMINGYQKRVRVENLAVSDGNLERVKLFSGRKYSAAEWNIVGHDMEGNATAPKMEIAATSLDEYFPRHSRLDFAKIDVEGAEADVLRGMRRLLHESRPIVLVEFHDDSGWQGRTELLEAQYELYNISGREPIPLDMNAPTRIYHCLAVPQERLKETWQR